MASELDLTRFYDVIIRKLGFLTQEFQIPLILETLMQIYF